MKINWFQTQALHKIIIKIRMVFVIICIGLTSIYVMLTVYVGLNVYVDNKTKSDAILVLGARSYKGANYNPCLVARVEHAVELYKQGYANKIIMSGGDDREDHKNEALTMQQIAQKLQVPMKDIILEDKATSTYENMVFSNKIMQLQQIKSVIIVTEPFHSPRAALVARKASLDYSISPTLTSQCWLRWKYGSRFFLKEPLAILEYFILGKI